jgi:hypothetical protein
MTQVVGDLAVTVHPLDTMFELTTHDPSQNKERTTSYVRGCGPVHPKFAWAMKSYEPLLKCGVLPMRNLGQSHGAGYIEVQG